MILISMANSVEMFSFQIQQNKASCTQKLALLKLGEKRVITPQIRPHILHSRNAQEEGNQTPKAEARQ